MGSRLLFATEDDCTTEVDVDAGNSKTPLSQEMLCEPETERTKAEAEVEVEVEVEAKAGMWEGTRS